MSEPNGRINVSEDKLNAALAGLELSIMKQIQMAVAPVMTIVAAKADHHLVAELQKQVADLLLWKSGQEAVSGLKWRQITVAVAAAAVIAGLIGSLATFYWLHKG